VLPRADLEALNITYRRIPVLAIGADVHCDSAQIIDTLIRDHNTNTDDNNNPLLLTSPADKAYNAWGDALFAEILAIIPLQALTPEFVRDRETVFPLLKRPDLRTLRPSGLAQFRSRLREVETRFLGGSGDGPFMHGSRISLADIHVGWAIRWAIQDLGVGKEVGCGREHFPRVWRLIEGFPQTPHQKIDAGRARDLILEMVRSSPEAFKGPVGVQENDPYRIAVGSMVGVESFEYAFLIGVGLWFFSLINPQRHTWSTPAVWQASGHQHRRGRD
jgi:glutathione S-transferase